MLDHFEVIDGVCQYRPRRECSLVDAVELIRRAIGYCRERRVARLLVDGTGLVGVPIPSLVDRFYMMEEWAEEAKSMVVVVLVIDPEYIHPQKFGVRVGADFGLLSDVYVSREDALKWLLSVDTAQ